MTAGSDTTTTLGAATDADRAAVAPTGRLRVAVAVGPASSTLWTVRDSKTGFPRGVTVDLGAALGEWLGLPVDLVEHPSSGAIIEAANAGTWDVGFAPVDAERKRQVLFGPDYFCGESTLLVPGGSPIRSLAEADAPGVKIVGVENTATIRSARRVLSNATVIGVGALDEALALVKAGEADAVGLGRESLESLLSRFPGGKVLEGSFHTATTAIAVPPTRAAALPVVGRFLEAAKADGTVRRIFDRHGLAGSRVAPAQR
jgi:polar amino acid transport system substrate-binding protein